MLVDAGQAEEELVADRLADNGCSGNQKTLDRGGMGGGRATIREPFGIPAAGPLGADIEHILHGNRETGQRPVLTSDDRLRKCMRNESVALLDGTHQVYRKLKPTFPWA